MQDLYSLGRVLAQLMLGPFFEGFPRARATPLGTAVFLGWKVAVLNRYVEHFRQRVRLRAPSVCSSLDPCSCADTVHRAALMVDAA